jgi:O-6-methylguanine DNA methyltransferase
LIGSLTGLGGVKIPGALMGAIVESKSLRATLTRYSVPGWGDGELWMLGDVVLAHDFRFGAAARPLDPVSDTAATTEHSLFKRALAPAAIVARPTGRSELRSSGEAIDTNLRQSPLDKEPCLTPLVLANELVARLTEYLAGGDVALDDVELDLSWATPFQCAVAAALRQVPRGEVVTYGELAAVAGFPGAARAVGSFCARNRFAVIVPCHRVVGAAGIGGYGTTGTGVKRRLLALEGVVA